MFFAALDAIENEYERTFIADLYSKYYTFAKARAKSILDDEDAAEEVVQEAFIKLIENVKTIMRFNKDVLYMYTMTSVKNLAIDYFRKRNHDKEYRFDFCDISEMHLLQDSKPLPDDLYIKQEKLYELSKVFEKIPEKYRNILERKYILRQSDLEIAQWLGISENSVRTYLTRARRQAFKIMEEESQHETSKTPQKADHEQSR